jgi:hypothetical protein
MKVIGSYSSWLKMEDNYSLPLLGGGWRGSRICFMRPHLNPPLKGDENKIRAKPA